MPDPDPLVVQLTEARLRQGMSRRALASAMGVQEHMVEGWELGRHKPSLVSLRRMAGQLGYVVTLKERTR